jgi:hypothetical protein
MDTRMRGTLYSPLIYLDSLVDRLLPQILADPDLGDGRVFTQLHFRHLWALSCLQIGEWYDEELLATCLSDHLPPQVANTSETRDEPLIRGAEPCKS